MSGVVEKRDDASDEWAPGRGADAGEGGGGSRAVELVLPGVPKGTLIQSMSASGKGRWFVRMPSLQLEVVRTLREAQYGRICACLPIVRREDGSFGHVRPAVALKMFHKADVARRHGRLSNSRIAEDAVAELAAWARVSQDGSAHPNIARLLAVAQDDRRIYAVTELAASDLFDWASQASFRLPLFLTRVLLAQMSRGLHHLHHRCWIAHRDLSLENTTVHFLPSNVPVTKIIDFGLCVDLGAPPEARPRIPLERSGKCVYMAPEVFTGAVTHYDPYKADVWSLGISFFILLSGIQPFEFPITAAQAAAHNFDVPPGGAFDYIAAGKVHDALLRCGAAADAVSLAGDLIARMLSLDADRRPAVDEILRHPFLSEVAFPPDLDSLYTGGSTPDGWQYADSGCLAVAARELAAHLPPAARVVDRAAPVPPPRRDTASLSTVGARGPHPPFGAPGMAPLRRQASDEVALPAATTGMAEEEDGDMAVSASGSGSHHVPQPPTSIAFQPVGSVPSASPTGSALCSISLSTSHASDSDTMGARTLAEEIDEGADEGAGAGGSRAGSPPHARSVSPVHAA